MCEEYSKLIITAFKHMMQLEYRRHMLKTKEQEVSALKKKWIERAKSASIRDLPKEDLRRTLRNGFGSKPNRRRTSGR